MRLMRQDGSAMVTAMMITMLMLAVTMTAIGFVDVQTRESGRERKRESTFQLTEAVMSSQIFLMSRQWPGTVGLQYPPTCSKANQLDLRCPDTATLQNAFRGSVDYKRSIDWTTEIRDNRGTSNYWDDAFVAMQDRWDSNRDGFMWVRAQGKLANGEQRVIVALVRAERIVTNFPRHAVVAGSIDITQNGNHEYVYTDYRDANGNLIESGRVVVRCNAPAAPDETNPCVNEKRASNVSPAAIETDLAMQPALNPDVIERLRETARNSGTYTASGCPATLTGAVVFVENANGCRFGSTGSVYNSAATPGVLVIGSGYFELQAGTFYGLVYHVNGSDGVGPALSTTAFSTKSGGVVVGQVIIDGNGRLEVGNNNGGPGVRGNINFDPRGSQALQTFGTAGIVQNSFREVRPRG